MKKLNTNNKIGLALEGGGAKGSYEIGAYVALRKLGFKFNMAVGTSIGALNAALIAQDDIKLAKKLWLDADSEIIGVSNKLVELLKNFKISKENIKFTFSEVNKIFKNKGLDISIYKKIIDDYIDEEKVRNSYINYGLVTVRLKDLKQMEVTIDDIEEGKLSDYIMASSYLPVFKMNKIIDNSYYLDGGVSNNLPITLLEKNGYKDIIAIKIKGIGLTKHNNMKDTNITYLIPTKDTGPVVLFDNNDIKNNYYMGYYDTLLYYGKLIGYKYYFKKFRFFDFLVRKVDDKILTLVKLKYKSTDIKEVCLKAIEEILEENKVYYYKIYKIPSIIKYIKKNNLKSSNHIVNEFIYSI